MYWLKSRYYYPELHRLINADVLVGHRNRSSRQGQVPPPCVSSQSQSVVCRDGEIDLQEGGTQPGASPQAQANS